MSSASLLVGGRAVAEPPELKADRVDADSSCHSSGKPVSVIGILEVGDGLVEGQRKEGFELS